eukprot:scaffold7076_cov149-Amphora_coffeaeformis.AAC.5
MDSENRKRKADEIAKPEEEEKDAAATATAEDGTTSKEPDCEETTKRVKVSSESNTNQEETEKETTKESDEKEGAAAEEKTAVDTTLASSTKRPKEEKTKTPESTAKDENTNDDKPKEEIKSIFGATTGFSGFGAVKPGSGFGFGSKNKTETPAFGSSGFGSSTTGTSAFGGFASSGKSAFGSSSGGLSFGTAKGFGALQTSAASGSAFGASNTSPSKKTEEDAAETSDSPAEAPIRPIVELPTNYEIRSGEEDETVLFEARCKTRRLVPAGSEEESDDAAATAPVLAAKTAPAVPPSQSLVGNNTTSGSSATPMVTWHDVGTGPLKVLQHKVTGKFRVVQRREVSPSGPATKVILNVPAYVGGLSKIPPTQEEEIETRQRFQWTTPVEGKAVTYLFKFSTTQEARELVKVLDGTQKSSKEVAPKKDEETAKD